MATVEELVKQYETDEKLQKEVEAILADGKITFMEFVTFAKKHHVNISPADFPKYVEEANITGAYEAVIAALDAQLAEAKKGEDD